MTAEQLLRELEPLTHDQRMRRMVELGQRAASDESVAATLAELGHGDFYARRLALQSCFGSRDDAHVARALDDASRSIRGLALVLAPLACSDAQLHAALDAASYSTKLVLLRRLHKRGRLTAVDAFLDELAAREDEDLGKLLPFGSPEAVGRHLERVLARLGHEDWRRLARHHPDLTADALEQRTGAAARLNRRLVSHANAALSLLAKTRPDRALNLVRQLARSTPIVMLELRAVVRRRPTEVADLLLNSGEQANVGLERVAHRLDVDQLARLIGRQALRVHRLQHSFRRFSSSQRAALYTAFHVGWRDADGCLPEWLVALLPRGPRQDEARRHLELTALVTRPAQRLPYAGYLPWGEAREILAPFIGDPDAELRGTALAALVNAARYERMRASDLIAMVHARRNEQDPVRCRLLTGMADLPPSMWHSEHLGELDEVFRAALDASDVSATTVHAVEQMTIALLPRHPAWSTAWLATLVQERGYLGAYDLRRRLSEVELHRVARALLPVLEAWRTREREAQLIAVAGAFGRRLRGIDGLVEVLEQTLRDMRSPGLADQALGILDAHRPDRIATLIPELLLDDPTWTMRPVVYMHLHRRRQDLLTPFLGQQAYRGRFGTGNTRFVLPIFEGFHRWTPTQQETFAKTLRSVTSDRPRDTPSIFGAIRQLAALPAVGPGRLVQLASPRHGKPAVREAALWALGGLDSGQGMPVLVDALHDDRARIAIYALRRAVLEMPASRALEFLRGVPRDKVTVAKEVVRLLSDLRSEEAYRELLALADENLQQDVRVALLRALWSHLERPQTWQVLSLAAESPDRALATVVGRIPADRLSDEAQRRLAALLASLLAHPDPTVRLDVLRRCSSLPLADAERALLPGLIAAISSTLMDESIAAADAVFTTYAGQEAPLVADAIGGLLQDRRALRTAIRALEQALPRDRRRLLPTARAILEAMAVDPLTANLRVGLATRALPWRDLAELLTRLAASGELHADALATATSSIRGAAARPGSAELASFESELARSSDERLRRIALAILVARAQPPHGWDHDRLARLQAYRADPAPLVAAAAQFTFPPEGRPTAPSVAASP